MAGTILCASRLLGEQAGSMGGGGGGGYVVDLFSAGRGGDSGRVPIPGFWGRGGERGDAWMMLDVGGRG